MGKADGWVNLGRVYIREGRIPDALKALEKASQHKPAPAAPVATTTPAAGRRRTAKPKPFPYNCAFVAPARKHLHH